MNCNVGPRERIIRLATGMALGAVAAARPMSLWKRIGLGAVAAAEVITATTRYCPINQLLGIDNCPESRQNLGSRRLNKEKAVSYA